MPRAEREKRREGERTLAGWRADGVMQAENRRARATDKKFFVVAAAVVIAAAAAVVVVLGAVSVFTPLPLPSLLPRVVTPAVYYTRMYERTPLRK